MNNAAAVLDQNGIAITAGDITVYNYDAENREYLSATVEYLAYGVGIPAHSCIDAPPENAPASLSVVIPTRTSGNMFQTTEAKRFTAQRMVNAVQITQPGDYPPDTTVKQPATIYDVWDGETWVTDAGRQHAAELEAAGAHRQQLEEQAMASVELINLKLRAGRRLTPQETEKLNAVLFHRCA